MVPLVAIVTIFVTMVTLPIDNFMRPNSLKIDYGYIWPFFNHILNFQLTSLTGTIKNILLKKYQIWSKNSFF